MDKRIALYRCRNCGAPRPSDRGGAMSTKKKVRLSMVEYVKRTCGCEPCLRYAEERDAARPAPASEEGK